MTTPKPSKSKQPKPKARPLKAEFKLPAKFEINLNYVVVYPPPTALAKCPRCEKPHKKLKPLKLKKPMEFHSPDGKFFVRASYWVPCPKTKEPVILFDRVDRGQSLENMVIKQGAEDIARQIDKEILADLDKEILADLAKIAKVPERVPGKAAKPVKKRGGKETPVAEQSSVTVTFGDTKAGVFDPNAPERIVPGTKSQARAQRARVKVQEKAVQEKAVKGRKR
jgi:hypothetical protein